MVYIKDVLGIFSLKDEVYRKIGNDPHAFKRVFGYTMLSMFLIILVFGIIAFTSVALFMPYLKDFNLSVIIAVFLAALIFIPLFVFLINYIVGLIPHGIGLLCGGSPRNYHDFLKVVLYPLPLILPLIFLFEGIVSTVYTIWSFFILYKTYRIIHKLDSHSAGLATALNVAVYFIFVVAVIILFLSLLAKNPGLVASLR
ncbi:MAG TPA: YIP1 family protein [Candidatus Nanoarchaeia archaeon]|nr:YIP1 family protein [Candidatus Nanoarchaeia archaeon]